MTVRLAPSILSADFSRLGEEIRRVEEAGVHQFHVDVMDGHYVPNLTFGPLIVEAARRSTDLPLDVHLMIEHADRWVKAFADAGADMIAVHPEALYHLHRTIQLIRHQGKKPGLAINPATPLGAVEDILPEVDYAIIMSVNPGFGGQKFIHGSFDRVRRLRSLIRNHGLSLSIEIDGGMDVDNIGEAVEAGVDVVIAGSAIFKERDPAAKVKAMLAATTA
ncbi:MAG: ribulose-phosphate 3-epimerase [Acidobacteriota bacterium]